MAQSYRVVESKELQGRKFESRLTQCGRKGCGSCPHGPYWYELKFIKGGKMHSIYWGKVSPGEVVSGAQRPRRQPREQAPQTPQHVHTQLRCVCRAVIDSGMIAVRRCRRCGVELTAMGQPVKCRLCGIGLPKARLASDGCPACDAPIPPPNGELV